MYVCATTGPPCTPSGTASLSLSLYARRPQFVPGERPAQVDTCIEVLRARGDLYERAGEIVRLCGDGVTPVSEAWLTDYFDRAIRFEKHGRDGVTRMNTPRQLINIVLAKRESAACVNCAA